MPDHFRSSRPACFRADSRLGLARAAGLASLVGLAAIGGCASAGSERTAAAGQPDEVICERQYTTGSNIPKMICMTREEREAGLQAVEEVRNSLNRASRTKGPGSTGP